MTQNALAELQRLLDAATPGPWELYGTDHGYGLSDICGTSWHVASCEESEDAALVIAAVNFVRDDLPALLADLTAANARVKEAEGVIEWFANNERGLQADIRSGHYARGASASEGMREDDRDFRGALKAKLAEAAQWLAHREGRSDGLDQ